jgi:hypothetical protein
MDMTATGNGRAMIEEKDILKFDLAKQAGIRAELEKYVATGHEREFLVLTIYYDTTAVDNAATRRLLKD